MPYAENLNLSTTQRNDRFSIGAEAVGDIGAAFFVFDIDEGLEIGEPSLAPAAEGMDLDYNIVNGQLRMLIYNIGENRIPAGVNDLVEIPYSGEGRLELSTADVADYQGQPYKVVNKLGQLPNGFALSQNYPNPFNPETSIEFALPEANDYVLTVYNVNGHLVRRFEGSEEAGVVTIVWDGSNAAGQSVASGVYLYRLEAGTFRATKKMVLLK